MLVVREVSPNSGEVEVLPNGENRSIFHSFRKYVAVLAMGLASNGDNPVELKQQALEQLRAGNTYDRGKELFHFEVAQRAMAHLIGSDLPAVVRGKVSRADLNRMGEFENTEEFELLTHDGLLADEDFKPFGVAPLRDEFSRSSYEGQLSRIYKLTHSATQFQFGVPPTPEERNDASYLFHTSLGVIESGVYVPVLTVLNGHYLANYPAAQDEVGIV